MNSINSEQNKYHLYQKTIFNEYTHIKLVTLQQHQDISNKQNHTCAWTNKELNPNNSVILSCGYCIKTDELLKRSFNFSRPGGFKCLSCNQNIFDTDPENHFSIPTIYIPPNNPQPILMSSVAIIILIALFFFIPSCNDPQMSFTKNT